MIRDRFPVSCRKEFPTKITFWGFNDLNFFVLCCHHLSIDLFYATYPGTSHGGSRLSGVAPTVLFSIHILQLFIGDISIHRPCNGGYNIPPVCPMAPFLFSVSGISPHGGAMIHPNHMPKSPLQAHFKVMKHQL